MRGGGRREAASAIGIGEDGEREFWGIDIRRGMWYYI